MRKIFENGIAIVVAAISLVLSWKWYASTHEIEPMIGMVAAAGILLTGIMYRIFPEQKEEAPPAAVHISQKNVAGQSSTFTSGANTVIGDGNTIITYSDGRKIPRFLTTPPFNTDFFIGRDNDLAAIETEYQQNKRLLVLVNGEGGMGKTTLAAQYWFQHEARYKHLAWIFANSGVGNALLSLATNLGVPFSPQDDATKQIARVAAAINNLDAPCLLVLDNANDASDLEKHYVWLNKLSNCHILLTSRVISLENVPVHRVLPLDVKDAVKVFQKHYPAYTESETPLLNSLLHAVGLNTLVIELLAKNLAVFNKFQTQYSLETLVKDLQNKGLLALQNKAVKVVYQSDSLRTATPESIITAMYDLSDLSDTEKYVLSNFAVLPAENIPYTVLIDLLKPDPAELYDEAFNSLQQKGWIEYRERDTDFKISPVIQDITRLKNEPNLLVDCETLIGTLVDKLQRDIIHEDNYRMSSVFVRYAETVAAVFKAPNYDIALLYERTGNYYIDIGNLEKAFTFYENYGQIAAKLCINHPDDENCKNILAISYAKLGETHTALGNLDQALIFYEDETKLSEELCAAYPTNVSFKSGLAIAYQHLGNTHTNLGNLQQALTFYEKFNRLANELYTAYATNVEFKNTLAISYSKLGNTHTALDNLDQALIFYEKDLSISEELYAAYPTNVSFKNGLAISYEKLGNTHTALGHLDQALIFYEDQTKLFEELYAAYPTNVSFKNGLAIAYQDLGITQMSLDNIDKALVFFKGFNKLMSELCEVFANNVSFKNNLAFSFKFLGRLYVEKKNDKINARLYFEQCQNLWEELGKNHPDFVQFQKSLKWVQEVLADLDK